MMKMAETVKFTPEPWINEDGLVNGRDSRPEYSGTPSIDIFDASEWPESLSEEAHATAALIAAAPDMLEALAHAEAILTYAPLTSTNKGGKGPNTNTRLARDKVRAAIAKAEDF